MMRRFLIAVLLLSACSQAPQEELGIALSPTRDGPPPPMGTVTLTGADGAAQVLTTYDFSIGALDGSAWFGGFDQNYTLNIRAFPDANPEATEGVVQLVANLPGPPEAGMSSTEATVKILRYGAQSTTMLWSSLRQPTRVIIETVTRATPEDVSGHATGRFETVLCDMTAPERNDCQPVTGRFDTDVQFDNM